MTMVRVRIVRVVNFNVQPAHPIIHVSPAKETVKALRVFVRRLIMKMEFQLSAPVVHSNAQRVLHHQYAQVV